MKRDFQHAVVLGLGSSGVAAAQLLRAEGTAVTVIDREPGAVHAAARQALEPLGVDIQLAVAELPPGPFDLCVASPGVPVTSPWIRAAQARGLPVLAELELGWSRRAPATRVMAVTGSNGKSNAVKWMAESLAEAGYRVAMAGNYGPPVCRVVREHLDLDWLVLEVSSFQLETVQDFRAEIALLLNLVPNHLDRHGDLTNYRRAKARLFARSEASDLCLVHEACAEQVRSEGGGAGRWLTFGSSSSTGYRYEDGKVWEGRRVLADLAGTYFGNEVLGVNGAGVVGAWSAAGLDLDAAVRASRVFRPLPSRMELVAEYRGVRFVNDSKATTLTALSAALRMCSGGVRLIAGGLLKETDLTPVKEVLAHRAAGVYLIGKASEQMLAAWSGVVPCNRCGTLAQAVQTAWREARPGDTVLLSPGCASFDQFRNFEERGEQFRQCVRLVIGK